MRYGRGMSDVSSARGTAGVPRRAERKAIELLADREVQPAHAMYAIEILHNALDHLDRYEGCCQWHNHNCEPPSELCCLQCPETAHPDHADGSTCVYPDFTPLSAYGQGWRDTVDAAQLCGAYNADRPPHQYALCIKRNDHTGMHDDMWLGWGDRHATAEDNRETARGHRAWIMAHSRGRMR